MAVKYDYDKDYKALMDEAAAKGDYAAAARYEQQRNAKIADANANGTNKWGATTSTDYAQYLGGGYTPLGTNTDSEMSAQDLALLNTYRQQYNNAISLGDRQTADAMHLAAETLRGTYGYSGGTDGSQYIKNEGAEAVNPNLTPDIAYPSFDYNDYVEQNAKPEYTPSYSEQIDAALNQILNRDAFSYDPNTDPVYQQYLSRYNREGNRAMNDTLASVASGAGGMNSYAITAAQQANDYYAAQAADKIPELYQLAYQMYLDDIDLKVNDLGLLQQMDETQYGRYRDQMSDWRNDLNFAYGMYRDNMSDYQWDKNFDYNAYWDNKKWEYNTGRDQIADERYDREWEYNTGRDEISDSRYESELAYEKAMKLLSSGAMPTADMLAAAGITEAQARAILTAGGFDTGTAGGGMDYTGGNGGTGAGADYTGDNDTGDNDTGDNDTGGRSREEIIAIQKELGVTPDGIWGPITQKAWDEKYGNGGEEEGGGEKNIWSEMNNLGIGPISASLAEELIDYGGVIETEDGSLKWANGWNATNYQSKLRSARSSFGAFTF